LTVKGRSQETVHGVNPCRFKWSWAISASGRSHPLEPQTRHLARPPHRPSHSLSTADAGMATVITVTVLCSGDGRLRQYRKFSGFNWLSRSCPSNDFPFLTDPRGLGTRDRAAARHSVRRPRVADCSSNRLRKCDAVPITLSPDARTLFIRWLAGFVSVSLAGRAKSNCIR